MNSQRPPASQFRPCPTCGGHGTVPCVSDDYRVYLRYQDTGWQWHRSYRSVRAARREAARIRVQPCLGAMVLIVAPNGRTID